VEALSRLSQQGVPFEAKIVGDPTDRDQDYDIQVRKQASALLAEGKLNFTPGVVNTDTPKLFSEYAIFINLTQSGSLDKTILEAMSCGGVALVSNESFREVLSSGELFNEGDVDDLVQKLIVLLNKTEGERAQMGKHNRQYVVANHSLEALVSGVLSYLE